MQPPVHAARLFGSLLALLAATGAPAAGTDGGDRAAAMRVSQAAIGRVVGDYDLTNQDGGRVRIADLRGRPLVLSFVYTTCYSVCPGLTLHLRDVVRIAREALGNDSFSVLTVGFDSANDTPDRMRTYARERGIDDARWYFASSDATTLRRLTDEAGFTWTATPGGFDHVAQVTIVDAAGTIATQVYGVDFPPPALVEPLKELVWGRGIERPAFRGLVDTVRLLCTVYDPVSGRYRFDYRMLVSALPVFLMLGIVGAAILFAGRTRR